jgi:hypothetical protein
MYKFDWTEFVTGSLIERLSGLVGTDLTPELQDIKH